MKAATKFFCTAIVAFVGCSQSEPKLSGPLRQRGYLWQREWTPAVIDSLAEAGRRLDGVVVLGAEINFGRDKSDIVNASINWEALKHRSDHCSLALRVAPYAGPFRKDDTSARTIASVTKKLLADARAHDVKLEEFQFDFDCPAKNLESYCTWLRMLRGVVQPTRFVITVLPAWLEQSEFPSLVREVDGYVLQVHSVPFSSGDRATLCEPRAAQKWMTRAARLGMPFSVALPTYRCSAGYRSDGKLLSVAMDSIQPVWPPGTRVLEFGANADEIAALVSQWQKSRPSQLRELLWYRVPIATDNRNWRWATLSAVMAGRPPQHQLSVLQQGDNPIDLSVSNAGEADEQFMANVTATWNDGGLAASDALAGWNVRSENGRATFTVTAPRGLRLPPGATRKIGWLRFDRATTLETKLSIIK